MSTRSAPGGSSASGRWTMIPSSDQMASASRPSSSRIRARQRERPGGVDAAAERREDAEAPVADLVAEALDDDRRVARQDARRVLLLAQVVEEVLRRELVEVVLAHERRGVLVDGPAAERADRLAELLGAADRVAAPEGDGARHAGRGGDDDAVAADLLDPPATTRRAGTSARAAPRRPSPRRARRRACRRAASRRTGRGRGSCRRSSPRAGARPCGRGSSRRPGPTRCAAAARRTRPTGSARRACRGRSPAARG